MANFLYNNVANKIFDGTISISADTIKVMLVTSAYSANRDDEFVSTASGAEIVATNYTGGFGGAGRKTLASKTFTKDNANDRSEFDCADPAWTALGGATNATIAAAVIIKEITNDAASLLIGYIDTSSGSPSLPFTTNGGDFTLTVNVEGLIQLRTV